MAAPTEQRIAVPIDDPNADTEWYVPRKVLRSEAHIDLDLGTKFCANMVLYLRSPLPLLL